MDRSTKQRESGFTLIELTLAIAIIGASLTALLFLRASAAERFLTYANDQDIQKLATEKLDLVIHEVEADLEGVFDDEGHPDYTWRVELVAIGQEEIPLMEATLFVTYPTGPEETEEYKLTTWFYPDEESPLLAAAGIILDDEDQEGF